MIISWVSKLSAESVPDMAVSAARDDAEEEDGDEDDDVELEDVLLMSIIGASVSILSV